MLSRTQRAAKTLHDLRVGEVAELDVVIENGKVSAYRAKLHVSFKTKATTPNAEEIWIFHGIA